MVVIALPIHSFRGEGGACLLLVLRDKCRGCGRDGNGPEVASMPDRGGSRRIVHWPHPTQGDTCHSRNCRTNALSVPGQCPNGSAKARREKGGVEVQRPTKLALDTRLVPPWTDPCQSRDSGNQRGAKEIRLLPAVFAGFR